MGFCKWCMYYTCLRYHSLSRTNRVCIVRPAFSSSRDIRSVALPPTCYYNFPEKKLLSDPIKKRKRSVTSTKTREISSGARSFRMLCKSYLQVYQFQINRIFVILSFQINQEVEFGLLEVLLCFRILCLWFLYYMIHLNVVYCFFVQNCDAPILRLGILSLAASGQFLYSTHFRALVYTSPCFCSLSAQ